MVINYIPISVQRTYTFKDSLNDPFGEKRPSGDVISVHSRIDYQSAPEDKYVHDRLQRILQPLTGKAYTVGSNWVDDMICIRCAKEDDNVDENYEGYVTKKTKIIQEYEPVIIYNNKKATQVYTKICFPREYRSFVNSIVSGMKKDKA